MSISPVPATYNVYGYIDCGDKITAVRKVLIRALGINDNCALLDKGILKIESPRIEAEIKRKEATKWSVNAAIAGGSESAITTVNTLAKQLSWNGISSTYEVYNDEFECIKNIEMVAKCKPGNEGC